MEQKNETKTVRDARGEARRLARKGGGTYQQCLDQVARERNYEHWKAFMADNEADPRNGAVAALSIRDVVNTPLTYDAWRTTLPVITSDNEDQANAERVARWADSLSKSLDMPLWVIAGMPAALVILALTMGGILRDPTLVGIIASVTMGILGMVACTMVIVMVCMIGNGRESAHFRRTSEAVLHLMQMAVIAYVLFGFTLASAMPTMTAPADAPLGIKLILSLYPSPLGTLANGIGAYLIIETMIQSIRWTMVVASRHPRTILLNPLLPRDRAERS